MIFGPLLSFLTVNQEQLMRCLDSPWSWGLIGFFIGLGLGASTASAWPLAIGLVVYVLYLRAHGPARPNTETRLFATGPVFLMTWIIGFVVHGWAF
jgi:hypothetical protein